MYFRKSVFSFALLWACSWCVLAQDSDARDRIRVDTRLISVPVVVGDRNGRYIPGLTAQDFSVFQDGMPQAVAFFAPVEEPLTIALLIDTSQSTRPVLSDIKESARYLIKLLSPEDRVMIASFDYDIHLLSELTADRDQLRRAVDEAEIPRFVGTRLRDAAYKTVTRSLAGVDGRKAVIVLTDGKDVDSRISRSELIHTLQESDTLVYTIMFRTEFGRQLSPRNIAFERQWRLKHGRPSRSTRPGEDSRRDRSERMNRRAAEILHQLADNTGGRFYAADDGKLKKTFAAIVEELRLQYRLGFYPPDDAVAGPLYELKVKVDRPGVAVRSRTHYRIK